MTPAFERTFTERGTFKAIQAATLFLNSRGFSVGSGQAGSPRGIMFGDVRIAKWRNLRADEREALHGLITGDTRNGPVKVVISITAPAEAIKAAQS